MEATNRIIEILEKSGLTPSEFADKIDVQRSAISHITSGRNKPSLEFLTKIKLAFPEIDTDWLIFGIEKETEIEEISPENENTSTSSDFYPTLFDTLEKEELVEIPPSEHQNPKEKIDSEIGAQKKIVKALLFYSDGSFEDFVPSPKLL